MSRVDELRGLPAHRLVQLAGLPVSLAQMSMLKSIEGAPLDRAERAMFRKLTHTHWPSRPRPEGYREAYLRLGRRSGKSTRVCAPLAVSALLAPVDHLLAPGETARVLLVAPNRDQTRTLVDTSAGLLDLLGIPHEKLASAVRVPGLRVSIETATADAVSPRGPTAVLVIVDEAALLPSETGAAGNDRELIAALRPTLATTKGRLAMVSTPWGKSGVHYEKVEAYLSKTAERAISFAAPTWVCNPGLSEAQTREEEDDERVWRREWAAIPGDVDSAAFSSDDLEACVDRGVQQRPPVRGVAYAVGIDDGGRQSGRALVVVHRDVDVQGDEYVERYPQDLVRRWAPGTIDHDEWVTECVAIGARYNHAVFARDLFSGDANAAAFRSKGGRTIEVSMSPQAQAQRFRHLQALVEYPHRLRLLDNAQQMRELRGLRETLHQGGRISFSKGSRRGEFDDIADALAIAIEQARLLPSSGGSTARLDVPLHNTPMGLFTGRPRWVRTTASGEEVEVAPPPHSREFRALRARRWLNGVFLPSEMAEGRTIDDMRDEAARDLEELEG